MPGPKRARARRPVIPNEIFLKILSYIQLSVDMGPADCTHILSRLSLVCNFFCTTLRPRRFRWLILGEKINPRSEAFCEALMSGDAHAQALALHIRNCTISHWPPRNSRAATGPQPTPFVMISHWVLFWAPNVEFLQLRSSKIGTELWNITRTLSNLKTFKVSSVSFKDDIPAKAVDHVAGMRLSSLEISRSQVFSLPQLLNTTVLSELTCHPDTLETLLTSGPISTLETLTLGDHHGHSVSIQSLMKILSKVPSVCDLTISSHISQGGPKVTPQEFDVVLPNLRSLACRFLLLAFMAPGRPLVSLRIMAEYTRALDLDAALGSHGLHTITHLSIPSTISLTPSHFPCLCNLVVVDFPLEVDLPGPEATVELTTLITEFFAKWPIHSSLQRLHISVDSEFFELDLALQHAVLTRSLLSCRFPALRWFKLGIHVEWERFDEDDPWRVLIPAKDRADIVARIAAGDPYVVDHGEYLQQLGACPTSIGRSRYITGSEW